MFNQADQNYLNDKLINARNWLMACALFYIIILIALILNAVYKPGMSFWINFICGFLLFGVSISVGVHIAQYKTMSNKLKVGY
jgi:sugar phosphate permease